MNRRPNAFTLIELLVVIAIIAILAAILFPVFAQARAKGRQAACISNGKQIGMAIMQYSQDYDESYPLGRWDGGNGNRMNWVQATMPYMKSLAVYLCPDDPFDPNDNANKNVGAYWLPSGTPAFRTSYAYNMDFGVLASSGAPPARALADIVKPASTVMIADAGAIRTPGNHLASIRNYAKWRFLPNVWLLARPGDWRSENGSNNDLVQFGAPLKRHQEMSSVLWADGHVKAMRLEQFYNDDCFRLDRGCPNQ